VRATIPRVGSADTTAAIQEYLRRLDGASDEPAAAIVRELLERSANRLHTLCVPMLYRSYPRLTRPPLNLQAEEMLSAVVERLMKALRHVRPEGVRQYFALATQHMRWELNELARQLDAKATEVGLDEEALAAPESETQAPAIDSRRILAAIDALPTEEREVFDLVRIQGLSHPEAAEVLGVATKTVQRRLHRALLTLSEA